MVNITNPLSKLQIEQLTVSSGFGFKLYTICVIHIVADKHLSKFVNLHAQHSHYLQYNNTTRKVWFSNVQCKCKIEADQQQYCLMILSIPLHFSLIYPYLVSKYGYQCITNSKT